MPFAATLGAVLGVGVTCFKNNLCYLPYYRKPWEHVISAGVFGYAFQWIAAKEDDMVRQIEEYYDKLDAKTKEKLQS